MVTKLRGRCLWGTGQEQPGASTEEHGRGAGRAGGVCHSHPGAPLAQQGCPTCQTQFPLPRYLANPTSIGFLYHITCCNQRCCCKNKIRPVLRSSLHRLAQRALSRRKSLLTLPPWICILHRALYLFSPTAQQTQSVFASCNTGPVPRCWVRQEQLHLEPCPESPITNTSWLLR